MGQTKWDSTQKQFMHFDMQSKLSRVVCRVNCISLEK